MSTAPYVIRKFYQKKLFGFLHAILPCRRKYIGFLKEINQQIKSKYFLVKIFGNIYFNRATFTVNKNIKYQKNFLFALKFTQFILRYIGKVSKIIVTHIILHYKNLLLFNKSCFILKNVPYINLLIVYTKPSRRTKQAKCLLRFFQQLEIITSDVIQINEKSFQVLNVK